MMKRPTLSMIGVVIGVAFLIGVSVWLQTVRDSRFPLPTSADETVYLTQRAVSRFAFTYRPLVADLYWIRAIQYFGGHRRDIVADQSRNPGRVAAGERPPALTYDELYPLLEIATTLDPQFNIVYRFGAIFLAEKYPDGADRPDLAVQLLEKGLRERPDKWEYMQDIGFVHYWYDHDYRAAAEAFDRASRMPGAPWWLKSLAATTLAQGGDRRSSRLMWETIRQSAENDWLRRQADRRLAQLRALDEIDVLQAAVDRFTAQTGTPPSDWLAVARANRWRGVPVDPEGVPYQIGMDGRVRVSARSPLSPMPEEPQTSRAVRPPS